MMHNTEQMCFFSKWQCDIKIIAPSQNKYGILMRPHVNNYNKGDYIFCFATQVIRNSRDTTKVHVTWQLTHKREGESSTNFSEKIPPWRLFGSLPLQWNSPWSRSNASKISRPEGIWNLLIIYGVLGHMLDLFGLSFQLYGVLLG